MKSLRRLQRRTFVKAVGLGIAAPLALKLSKLAAAAPGERPTRLFIFYVPHGIPIEHFDPGGEGTTFDLTASGLGILSPLTEYSAQLNVIRGISMAGGATNHAAIRAVLTGGPEGPGDSIDAVIASELGVTPHVVGAHPYQSSSGFSSDSYLVKHGTWVRPTESPVDAAEAYFQGLGSDPGNGEVDEAELRRETLALTESELEALQSELSSLTHEQDKLKLHLDAIRSLKAGGSDTETVSCDSRPSLPAVDAVQGVDPLDQTQFGKIVDAHLEAAAAAMVCGSARVITMQNMYANSTLNFGFEGGPAIAKGHHDPISHSWDTAGRAEFAECQTWFYERLATKLLSALNQTDPADPDHTVLDNSIVYVCSEVSDGANHNSDASSVWLDGQERNTYLPTVIIGGGGGYLRTGQVVSVERYHSDVLATIAAAMGVSVTTVGGQNASVISELVL